MLKILVNNCAISLFVVPGDVYLIDDHSRLNRSSVDAMFQRLIDLRYRPYCGTLYFGKELSSTVTLCPPPTNYKDIRDFETIEANVSSHLVVKGMLSMSDVASPPVVSRHLVLTHDNNSGNSTDGTSNGPPDTDAASRTPSLCVFLHGAMKTEGLCGLVQVKILS